MVDLQRHRRPEVAGEDIEMPRRLTVVIAGAVSHKSVNTYFVTTVSHHDQPHLVQINRMLLGFSKLRVCWFASMSLSTLSQ